MDHYDEKLARQVWQRVQGTSSVTEPGAVLAGIVQEQRQCERYCRRLADAVSTEDAKALQELGRQWREQADCLTGIAVLQGREPPAALREKGQPELPDTLLRRCAGAALRSARRLEALTGDGEYGDAFRELARRERALGMGVLCCLGRLSTATGEPAPTYDKGKSDKKRPPSGR